MFTIKENNEEKSFCWHKLPFCWCKLRKAYFASSFSCRGKKFELQGLISVFTATFCFIFFYFFCTMCQQVLFQIKYFGKVFTYTWHFLFLFCNTPISIRVMSRLVISSIRLYYTGITLKAHNWTCVPINSVGSKMFVAASKFKIFCILNLV